MEAVLLRAVVVIRKKSVIVLQKSATAKNHYKFTKFAIFSEFIVQNLWF